MSSHITTEQKAYELWIYRQAGRSWLALADQQQIYCLDVSLDHIARFTGNRYCAQIIDKDQALGAVRVNLGSKTACNSTAHVGLLDINASTKEAIAAGLELQVGRYIHVECLNEPRENKGAKLKLFNHDNGQEFKRIRDWSNPAKALFLRYKSSIAQIFTNSPKVLKEVSAWNGGRKTSILRSDDQRWQRLFDCLSSARSSNVTCANLASLLIEPVRTLTAIDINSAGNDPFAANMAAVPHLAEQIRLRNLSGLIVIDALSMKPREQRLKFDEALALSLSQPSPFGAGIARQDISAMDKNGVVILHRRRQGFALHEQDPAAMRALDYLALLTQDQQPLPEQPSLHQALFEGILKPAYAEARGLQRLNAQALK